VSVYELRQLWCGACGYERTVQAVDSANPMRHPPFLVDLLARTFQRHPCPRCGQVDVLDGPMLWTDVNAGLVAWVLPARERPRWSSLEGVVGEGLARTVAGEGPAFVRAWGRTATLRLVFGLEELREKVVASRARLDDRTVEALKLRWADGELATAPVLDSAGSGGLVFASPDLPHRRAAVVPWEDYHRTADGWPGDASCRGLAEATWVHWLRAAFPRHAVG
jgi:hypothetical protein